jgi:hypothetical protein
MPEPIAETVDEQRARIWREQCREEASRRAAKAIPLLEKYIAERRLSDLGNAEQLLRDALKVAQAPRGGAVY